MDKTTGAHRSWWASIRKPRHDPDQVSYFPIRHGKGDEIGALPYVVRFHAPAETVTAALATPDEIAKAVSRGDGRWITVHPNGEDQPGQPLLIKDNPDGTSTVVGGAGGKLNGLRMSLVRSESDYQAEMAARSKQERQRIKAEREALIERVGVEEYKAQVAEQKRSEEERKAAKLASAEHLARTVLTAQGIDADAILTVPDHALAGAKTPEQVDRIKAAHVQGVAKYARSVASDVRKQVVTALEAHEPIEGVAFADVVKEALSGKTPGYTLNASSIASSRGIVPTEQQVASVREESAVLRAEGDREEAARRMASTAKLQAGAARARQMISEALQRAAETGSGPHVLPGIDAQPVSVEHAGAILAAERAYREASKNNPPSSFRPVTPMAFDPESEGIAVAAQSVVDDMRTASMLRLVDMTNAQEAAGNSAYSHLSKARYAHMASIAAQLLPGATIDPALVDFLGSSASAQLLVATSLATSGPEAVSQVREALVHGHLENQAAIADKATTAAQALLNRAGESVVVDASNADSVIAGYASVQDKKACVDEALRHLGESRGQLESAASIIHAIDRAASNGIEGTRVVVPGSYQQAMTVASVMLDGLDQGTDFTVVSPQSGRMAIDITAEGLVKLGRLSGLTPNDNVSNRLAVVQEAMKFSGGSSRIPQGLRREIDAPSVLHGVASAQYGTLNPSEKTMIRTYWAKQNGIDAAKECDPYGNLTTDQETLWRVYQGAVGEGAERELMQSDLRGRVDSLAQLNLDADDEVLAFARTYADAIGLDTVRDNNGSTVFIPALDERGNGKRAANYARPRIERFMRTVWSAVNGVPEFDPGAVKPVSQAWTQYCRAVGGDMAATENVQTAMKMDPEVVAGEGKMLTLTEGQERMIHMIVNNRRMAAGLGAGAGKTLVMMGAFAQAKSQGTANRALVAVPSAVVGQFGSEWNRFVDPNSGMTMHAAGGDPHKTTLALAGQSDFVVMTHEGLRQRLLAACAEQVGTSPERMAERLRKMSPQQVDEVVHAAMDANEWNFDFFAYDEGHKTLGRQGKEESLLSLLLDSASRKPTHDGQLPHYVFATADPAKNDVSELHSLLGKIDPARFTPDTRDQFVRSYGRNTQDCAIALRNLMSPYLYTQPVELDVQQNRNQVTVPLTDREKARHDEIMSAYTKARLARAMGNRDQAAEKTLGATNPKALALSRDNAISRELLWSGDSSKASWVRQHMAERRNRPTVIFARNRASVEVLSGLLEADGHKVQTLTGSDSGLSKRKKREAFQDGTHDVLICTDAAEAGMNLQRGNMLINFDVPMTAKTLEQRIARQVRMGQKNDVDVYNLVSDCAWDRRNQERLTGKGALREIITAPFELADDTGVLEREMREKAGV